VASKWIVAFIAAVLSAYAAAAVAQFGTPIDSALPLIAVVITVLAAVTHPTIQLAVPLLIGGEIAIADERTRLVFFGLVVGLAFGAAIVGPNERVLGPHVLVLGPRSSVLGWRAVVIALLAILLLRWIPFSNVAIWRELFLLVVALLIVKAMGDTPLGVAVGVAAALFTPLIPLRTIALPLLILVAIVVARLSGFGAPQLRAVSATVVAAMLLFFAWSGVLARAPRIALRGLPLHTSRSPVRMALAPGESVRLDPPENATAVILSGANIAQLRPGTIVGMVGGTPLRVGDIADWGFLRREHFYKSRNRSPRDPAGDLREYGQAAWIDGAGRIEIRGRSAEGGALVVQAEKRLPAPARLQIDAFELRDR
jgi:hypothetical protein